MAFFKPSVNDSGENFNSKKCQSFVKAYELNRAMTSNKPSHSNCRAESGAGVKLAEGILV